MTRRIYHVTPSGDVWRVIRAGATRAASVHENKSKAVARAKALAKDASLGQVKVHRRNGQIQTEFTYGEDPRRTRG